MKVLKIEFTDKEFMKLRRIKKKYYSRGVAWHDFFIFCSIHAKKERRNG